ARRARRARRGTPPRDRPGPRVREGSSTSRGPPCEQPIVHPPPPAPRPRPPPPTPDRATPASSAACRGFGTGNRRAYGELPTSPATGRPRSPPAASLPPAARPPPAARSDRATPRARQLAAGSALGTAESTGNCRLRRVRGGWLGGLG